MKMQITPIKTKKDYEQALEAIDKLWDAKPNTKEGDMLDVLATLVEAYEQTHYPIFPPDPVEAIMFRMDQLGLKKGDLAKFFGGANRVSEVLHRKRKLTLKMIKTLHDQLKIPYESLITV